MHGMEKGKGSQIKLPPNDKDEGESEHPNDWRIVLATIEEEILLGLPPRTLEMDGAIRSQSVQPNSLVTPRPTQSKLVKLTPVAGKQSGSHTLRPTTSPSAKQTHPWY